MDVEALRPDLLPVFAATTLRTYADTDFALVSLPPRVYVELLAALVPLHDLRFQAIVREPAEVSLIAPCDLWARIAGGFPDATVDAPWKLITFDISIPLDVYGYLEQITHLCARQGSSVIVASGYSTDHLLVAAAHYPAVLDALQAFIDRCRATVPAG